jgi:AcrR family transcriptional regulator
MVATLRASTYLVSRVWPKLSINCLSLTIGGYISAMSAPLQADAPGVQVGRPRDVSRDRAVLQAVRELLAEEGYQALSVHKVTQRCGVHVRTIARRWDTKAEMVAAAVLGGDVPLFSQHAPGLPTGRLGRDLRELIGQVMRYLANPATQAALPALLGEIPVNDKVRELFERREEEWVVAVRSVLERAVAEGDAPERVLGRERVLARVLAGSAYSLQFAPARGRGDDQADELAGFLLAALLGTA